VRKRIGLVAALGLLAVSCGYFLGPVYTQTDDLNQRERLLRESAAVARAMTTCLSCEYFACLGDWSCTSTSDGVKKSCEVESVAACKPCDTYETLEECQVLITQCKASLDE